MIFSYFYGIETLKIHHSILGDRRINIIIMDTLTKNPGLFHIVEEIFLNLEFEDLEKCIQVNESWHLILSNPSFWLEKCIQVHNCFMKNKAAWKKIVQLTRHTAFEGNLTHHLKEICDGKMNGPFKNITFSKGMPVRIQCVNYGWTPIHWAAMSGHTTAIKELVNMTEDPNASGPYGHTPMYLATENGHLDVIKLLLPFLEDPNAPAGPKSLTPMYLAAKNGHLDVIKLLAPFLEDPNAPAGPGCLTPIYLGAEIGRADIIEFLAPLTKNPNAPVGFYGQINGYTPIYVAAKNGHVNVVKLLAPLAEFPNAPNFGGDTPTEVAKRMAIDPADRSEIIRILKE